MACRRHQGYDDPICAECRTTAEGARQRAIRDQRELLREQEELRSRNERKNADHAAVAMSAAAFAAAQYARDTELEKERLRQERRRYEFEARTPCPGVCGMSIAMCRCLDLPCIGGCGKLGRNCECHLNVWCDTCEHQKRNCQCPEPPVQTYRLIYTPIILAVWLLYLIYVPASWWDSITFAPVPFFWMRVVFIGGILALVIGAELEANDNRWKAKWNAYQNTLDMLKETAKRRRMANSSDPPF